MSEEFNELEYIKGLLAEKGLRDMRLEEVLRDFINQICDIIEVKPPEIIVTDRSTLNVMSDGETDIAAYKPSGEYIVINKEEVYLLVILHELAHHVDYNKREIAHLEEVLESREKGIFEDNPNSKQNAREFIKEHIDIGLYLWRKKVEPIIGQRRIIPRWMMGFR